MVHATSLGADSPPPQRVGFKQEPGREVINSQLISMCRGDCFKHAACQTCSWTIPPLYQESSFIEDGFLPFFELCCLNVQNCAGTSSIGRSWQLCISRSTVSHGQVWCARWIEACGKSIALTTVTSRTTSQFSHRRLTGDVYFHIFLSWSPAWIIKVFINFFSVCFGPVVCFAFLSACFLKSFLGRFGEKRLWEPLPATI